MEVEIGVLEAARLLGITRITLTRYIETGRLKASDHNPNGKFRVYRIKLSELKKFQRKSRV